MVKKGTGDLVVDLDTLTKSGGSGDLAAIKTETDSHPTLTEIEASTVIALKAQLITQGTNHFNNTALQDIQDESEDALEGEYLDHFLKLDGAAHKYPENCAEDSILAKLIAKGHPAVPSTYDNATDSLEALYDALAGGVSAVNRVAGKTQILEVSIISAANAGNVTVATINTEACVIQSVILHADAAQTGDLTTAAVYGGAGNVITFIAPGDATQANLNAADKQVAWVPGAVRLGATKTITIDLQGTGATAVDLTVTIVFVACANGGYLS